MKFIRFRCDHHFHKVPEEETVKEKILRKIQCEQSVCIERTYTSRQKCCACSKTIKKETKYVFWEKEHGRSIN